MASSARPDFTSRVLRHERLIVLATIGLLVAASWWFLLTGAGLDTGMAGMAMGQPPLGALVLMWWLMMVAMMLPSATPAILLYARVRAMRGRDADVAQTWIFATGYLLVWLLFSLGAATAQGLLTGGSMALASAIAQGAVLLAAGVYQLSPLKAACLRQCRSPAQFISRHWRAGTLGAARLGILHGAYCVGCCWLLMALLFVGGVMNFAWIALLTVLVAVEKLVPRGDWVARATGVTLIAWGLAKLVG